MRRWAAWAALVTFLVSIVSATADARRHWAFWASPVEAVRGMPNFSRADVGHTASDNQNLLFVRQLACHQSGRYFGRELFCPGVIAGLLTLNPLLTSHRSVVFNSGEYDDALRVCGLSGHAIASVRIPADCCTGVFFSVDVKRTVLGDPKISGGFSAYVYDSNLHYRWRGWFDRSVDRFDPGPTAFSVHSVGFLRNNNLFASLRGGFIGVARAETSADGNGQRENQVGEPISPFLAAMLALFGVPAFFVSWARGPNWLLPLAMIATVFGIVEFGLSVCPPP